MAVPRFVRENALLLLLVFVPVALLLDYVVHAGALWIFLTSSLAIIPLAALMGQATEALAVRLGEGVGGLLNATFGNAAELIIAIVALNAGLYELVKASITGSIIGNVLLVFGASALYGGIKYQSQNFNRTAASLGATMLVLSGIGLVVPAVFHVIAEAGGAPIEQELSLEIAIVLMVTYVLSLLFTLHTHSHLYTGGAHDHAGGALAADHGDITGRGDAADHGHAGVHGAAGTHGHAAEHSDAGARGDAESPGLRNAILLLLAATIGVALMAELLVGAVEETAVLLGMNEVFVGVILVALIGNAAEHSTAILMAGKDKMDAAVTIAVGSSIQIALFVAPLLVFLSYFIGPAPMDLLFTTLEVVAVALCVAIISFIANDGETHWMEGVQLLAVYIILGLAFYFLPVPHP